MCIRSELFLIEKRNRPRGCRRETMKRRRRATSCALYRAQLNRYRVIWVAPRRQIETSVVLRCSRPQTFFLPSFREREKERKGGKHFTRGMSFYDNGAFQCMKSFTFYRFRCVKLKGKHDIWIDRWSFSA